MSSFFEALDQGYSPDDIIKYLSKAIPQIANPVRRATKAGYTTQQILGFLSKNFDTEDRRGMTETERHAANRRSDAQMVKYGLKMAAGAIGAPLAGMAVRSALSRALPQSLQGLVSQAPDSNIASATNATNLSDIALAPTQQQPHIEGQKQISSQEPPIDVSNNISQKLQPIQPQGIINPKEYLEKNGILDRVKELLGRGNTPEGVAAALGMKRSGEAKVDPELLKNIEAYAKEAQNAPQELPSVESQEQKLDVAKEAGKIEKSSIVASPHGVGEVKEIRNGKAIIDVDGKKHRVNEDDLIQSPIPEKELADLYDELIGGIEKQTGQQVSRNVEWAGYDPVSNELAYKPHGSDKLYAYDDISPEDIKVLTGLLTQRKSTGQNFIGAWEKGTTSPIGAAMYQLIQKLQSERGGKGNEYKNKYETIYDAIEPAKSASKKRYAERKKKAKKPRLD